MPNGSRMEAEWDRNQPKSTQGVSNGSEMVIIDAKWVSEGWIGLALVHFLIV